MKIKVKYFDKELPELTKTDRGDWIDLRASKTVDLASGNFYYIPLGVAIELPKGYEAYIVPRSSTFKNWGILQVNNVGIIDNTYCGDNDEWMLPVYATRTTQIIKGQRICQFRIQKAMPTFDFETVETLGNEDRNGLGSSGVD